MDACMVLTLKDNVGENANDGAAIDARNRENVE
jgi:hypothetical protein